LNFVGKSCNICRKSWVGGIYTALIIKLPKTAHQTLVVWKLSHTKHAQK